MKYFSVYLYLIAFLIESAYTLPELMVVEISQRRINPRGYSISVKISCDDPQFTSIDLVRIHSNADMRHVIDLTEADFSATIRQPTDGYWVFYNVHQYVNPGTIIIFKLTVIANFYNGVIKKSFSLGEYYSRPLASDTFDMMPANKSRCDAFVANCEHSLTTAGGKCVCKGILIFEDNFDTLDTVHRWNYDVRIPKDDKDSFASFQKRSENCYVENGQLHIIPTLLSDVPGNNESTIRTGKLKVQSCTPFEDEFRECQRQAYTSQILPPIVSAKIQTKYFFSFRYGEVLIRAKLPQGDWLFPLILLNPLENYSGYSSSGDISVAFTRGNRLLLDSNGNHISGDTIFGGPVESDKQYLNTTPMSISGDVLGSDFHNYSLMWTADYISVKVDGTEYARVTHSKEPNKLQKPFDKELFLTLGVSAGGHMKFPDGCLNGEQGVEKPWDNSDPKAMLNFWKDRENWRKTWDGSNAGLHVDFIKVYAL